MSPITRSRGGRRRRRPRRRRGGVNARVPREGRVHVAGPDDRPVLLVAPAAGAAEEEAARRGERVSRRRGGRGAGSRECIVRSSLPSANLHALRARPSAGDDVLAVVELEALDAHRRVPVDEPRPRTKRGGVREVDRLAPLVERDAVLRREEAASPIAWARRSPVALLEVRRAARARRAALPRATFAIIAGGPGTSSARSRTC